jgi:hypothetical protein
MTDDARSGEERDRVSCATRSRVTGVEPRGSECLARPRSIQPGCFKLRACGSFSGGTKLRRCPYIVRSSWIYQSRAAAICEVTGGE